MRGSYLLPFLRSKEIEVAEILSREREQVHTHNEMDVEANDCERKKKDYRNK